jgi:hypothetical protein
LKNAGESPQSWANQFWPKSESLPLGLNVNNPQIICVQACWPPSANWPILGGKIGFFSSKIRNFLGIKAAEKGTFGISKGKWSLKTCTGSSIAKEVKSYLGGFAKQGIKKYSPDLYRICNNSIIYYLLSDS